MKNEDWTKAGRTSKPLGPCVVMMLSANAAVTDRAPRAQGNGSLIGESGPRFTLYAWNTY